MEEYYIYDPDRGRLQGWLRNEQGQLAPIAQMRGWRSPRLDITFGLDGLTLLLIHPDGSPFLNFVELAQRREEAEERALSEMLARADLEESLTAAQQRTEVETQARQKAEQAQREAEQAQHAAEEHAQAEAQARAAAEAQLRELEARLKIAGLS